MLEVRTFLGETIGIPCSSKETPGLRTHDKEEFFSLQGEQIHVSYDSDCFLVTPTQDP